jgi:dihydroxyacetone kinase-like predicted kinase
VIRECAGTARALASGEIGLERLFAGIVEAANRAVDSSPDLLPVLRRGVCSPLQEPWRG